MPRSRTILTLGLLLTTFGVALEALSILPVAPMVAADLPDGMTYYGLMFAGFFFGSALAIVASGPVVDRRGPAPVLIVGLGAFTAGLLIGGLAPTMEVLIAGRVIQGAGAGMVNAVAFATVALAYTPAERPRILALLSLAWLLPSVIGPLVGGLVAEAFGWRWVFLGLAFLMPLCALLVVPQVLGLPRGSRDPAPSGKGMLRAILPPTGEVRIAATVALLVSMAILGAVGFAPLALSDIRGLSSLEVGITIAMLSVSWSAGTFLQARFPRQPTSSVARAGSLCLVVGLPMVGLSAVPAIAMPIVWVGWLLSGLGAGLAFQGTNLHLLAHAAAGMEGRATAAGQLASVVGNGIGTWFGGVLLAFGLGVGLTLDVALALVFTGCLAAALSGLIGTFRMVPTAVGSHHARPGADGG